MDQEKKTNLPNATPLYIYVIIGLLVLVLALQGYFMFFKTTESMPKETVKTGDVLQAQKNISEVTGLEKKVNEKQAEISSFVDTLKKKGGDKPPIEPNLLNLSPDQQKLFEQYIKSEQDVSLKTLLQEILEKNKEIWELRDKIANIEIKLPPPHIVREGETHLQIAMDFLTNKMHVGKTKAQELVDTTLLLDPLKSEFKVWNFYSEGIFISSVTQGNALISPNVMVQQEKQGLKDARDKAEYQRDILSSDIRKLEKLKAEIQQQLDRLNKERESLLNTVSGLNEQINSLFYLVDSEKNLEKRKILTGGFLQSTKFICPSIEHFNKTIDLRSQTYISISASDLGIGKIKSVTIYPTFYKKGTNYNLEISPDRKTATVILLEPDPFKNKQVVLSVK